ncbi:WD40-repeat-containing domain protein [Schizophyllum amplum]|uniref:WD40-repeat-containing domain protein n=1 Tax=Schizophyllum amplum TaxID=97359 RepID=A0A550CSN2_9AGAR|nr:WD40-repeat-containing domain protein [Auriculariopsis ampla]
MEYAPVVVQQAPRPGPAASAEARRWRSFKHPVFVKEYAPVTAVHFSPARPHRYAVTAATRVQIYAPRTQKVVKTISRFKDVARSGHIRADGKLVVAGDDSGLVQIFDINSRAILRTLDAHKLPVHVAQFSTLAPTQVLTCSDDTTVRLWDVPSQTALSTFTSHTDYVRAGAVSTTNPALLLTGSYDGSVRLFDARTGACELAMLPSGGGAPPVEQAALLPAGTVAVSSAGPVLRVWDLVAGGRCTRALANHQKTVTALALTPDGGRLLTGGLDRMVKVYDVASYRVVHTMRYPAPVLCLALSPDETHLAAGMADGTLSVRRRQPRRKDAAEEDAGLLTGTAYEAFLGGSATIGQGAIRAKGKAKAAGETGEFRVESRRRRRLRDYDRLLKAFKYSAALDAVLKKNVPPSTTFAVIQELAHRDGLRTALAGRDDVLLEPVLRVLLKHVADPRFGGLVCDVARVVLEIYAPALGQSPLIDALVLRLRRKVAAELRFQREVAGVRGALDMLLAGAALGRAV